MAAVLYEPAFVIIVTWFGDHAERTRALLALTVVAGFASAIYVPLAGWLVQTYGWREALLVLAALLATVLGRRWPLAAATAAIFAGQALAIPILVLTNEPAGVVAFVALFGLGVGLISLVRAALVAEVYGVAAYASINGVLALPLTLARAAAPVAAAGLRTATGNYRLVMAAVALCAVVASLAMLHTHRLQDRQGLPSAR
jgi:MFS family permease